MNLVFLGPPGAGKGTQAQLLQQREGIPQIGTGDILRHGVAAQTRLGRRAKTFVDRGELVPDDVMTGLIEERLDQPDTRRGFVLDGFPRTLGQARALDRLLEQSGRHLDVVVYFDVTDDVLIRRLTGRRVCRQAAHIFHVEYSPPKIPGRCDIDGSELYQRDDDREQTVRRRLEIYHRDTEPLVDFYRTRDVFASVPDGSIETVYQRLLAIIKTRAGSRWRGAKEET